MKQHASQETRTKISCKGKQPASTTNTKLFKLPGICKDSQETKIQWRDWNHCLNPPVSHIIIVCRRCCLCYFWTFHFRSLLLALHPTLFLFKKLSSCLPKDPTVCCCLQVKLRKRRCQRLPDEKNFWKCFLPSRHSSIIACKFLFFKVLLNQDYTYKKKAFLRLTPWYLTVDYLSHLFHICPAERQV